MNTLLQNGECSHVYVGIKSNQNIVYFNLCTKHSSNYNQIVILIITVNSNNEEINLYMGESLRVEVSRDISNWIISYTKASIMRSLICLALIILGECPLRDTHLV